MACVTILLATRNGADHLHEQLQSLMRQSHEDWRLWVSDDRSTDETPDILEWFRKDCGREVQIFEGPCKGATANFMSLLHRPDLPKGPLAYCDQDDVWFPGKLDRALTRLSGQAQSRPALYAGRAKIGASPELIRRDSPLFRKPPSFRNALIQAIGGGNTMMLSAEAVALMRAAGPRCRPAFHDWWSYQLVAGAGGAVIYDSEPMIFYRQHEGNMLGGNRGLSARRGRIGSLMQGKYHHWVSQNLKALGRCEELLTPDNRQVLSEFRALRKCRGTSALRSWRRAGLYRQNPLETALMATIAMTGRI